MLDRDQSDLTRSGKVHTLFPQPDEAAQHRAAARVRAEIEAHIEKLIAILDLLDEDPDLEADSDAEPSLGWNGNGWQPFQDDRGDDREYDIADVPHDQADEGNDEPSLGRLETVHQGRGSYGGSELGVPDRNAWAQGSAPAAVERPDDAIGFLRIVPMRRG